MSSKIVSLTLQYYDSYMIIDKNVMPLVYDDQQVAAAPPRQPENVFLMT